MGTNTGTSTCIGHRGSCSDHQPLISSNLGVQGAVIDDVAIEDLRAKIQLMLAEWNASPWYDFTNIMGLQQTPYTEGRVIEDTDVEELYKQIIGIWNAVRHDSSWTVTHSADQTHNHQPSHDSTGGSGTPNWPNFVTTHTLGSGGQNLANKPGYLTDQTGDIIISADWGTELRDYYNVIRQNCICHSDCSCNNVCSCHSDCGCHYNVS